MGAVIYTLNDEQMICITAFIIFRTKNRTSIPMTIMKDCDTFFTFLFGVEGLLLLLLSMTSSGGAGVTESS